MSTAAPVMRAEFTLAPSEPVRADQGVEEVGHEAQPHGSSDQVFEHAFTTHPRGRSTGAGDAALTALDATLMQTPHRPRIDQ